ncbi:hypothetical protein VTP01DRAFT_3243 [Rhizomucor pusillus]|uniref:uncharacterized protein n=1 Tax=Rhizomucor pusillus TaxID=4840 RepID=UPI0037439BE4
MQELGEDDASDKEQEENKNDQQEQQPTFTMKPRFRDLYMAQLTRAFGTDLDKIRQEPNFNESRLGLLIDSLEAGIDIFSNFEQDILSASAQNE